MRYHFQKTPARGRYAWAFRNISLERKAPALHTHDFYELYWIEYGSITEHRRDGARVLRAGDFRFAAPSTAHAFSAAPDAKFSLANVLFPADFARSVVRRHRLAWGRGLALMTPALTRLAAEFDFLAHSDRNRLDAECFLLRCFQTLGRQAGPAFAGPAWLQAALSALHEPMAFVRGADAFFEAARRSPEHAARECRRWTGRSPIQHANALRMQWAARELESSGRDISAIAMDSGLENLGHFYGLFGRTFGTTPRQWRLRAWRSAGLH